MNTVGKPLIHDSAALHVQGLATYVDDIVTPKGCLHLVFGVADIAHGTIQSCDLTKVHAAEGVVSVIRASDLPHLNDISPNAYDEPLLCTDKVMYHHMPLFLVVADSHHKARLAARQAKVSYTEKTPILTIDQALEAESRLEEPQEFLIGDPETVISEAVHQLEGGLEIGGQEHFYLESQAALAIPTEDGGVVIHTSSQHPSEIQHKVAEAIGTSMHQVRVEVRRMGGAFGGKESQGNALAIACALAALETGRPCKMRYDRDDDMAITGKRHDFRIRYRVGFDDQGKIAGIDFTHYVRCGWSTDLSLPIADRAMFHADNAYYLPHARIVSHRLRTHTASNTAFRGFGGPQGMVGIERVIDHIAQHLGKDPLEVRRHNFYRHRIAAKPQSTPYHMIVEDCIIQDLVDDLEKSSDYAKRRAAINAWNRQNPVIKKGIALTPVKFGISFTRTYYNQAGALVHVYHDGSIMMNHGGTEMGQGLYQKTAQIVAEVFGVPIASVKISATDTSKVPNTMATAASSGADLNGMAVKNAADTIKQRLIDFLVEKYATSSEDIVFEDGKVQVGNQRLTFAEVASLAYQARISLSSSGFYATPKIAWDRAKGRGRPFYYFVYAAAVTEVAIDTYTGENRILRADILLDAGKSLNPALDVGQLEGGYVQGAGWLTTEELVWNADGKLMTHAPSTYKIPACSCRPEVMHARLWDRGCNQEETIYRSKAVGEPPLMLGISAFMALSDAIKACGDGTRYSDLDAPATPERVYFAAKAQRGTDA